MKITELTAIAVRIFAICLFLYGLRQVAGLVGYIGPDVPGQPTISVFYYVAVAFVPLVIAIIIWMFPMTIARAFLPGDIRSSEIRISEGNSFLSASLIVLGIYVLTYAIPNFIYHFTRFYMIWRAKSISESYTHGPESIAYFAATIAELVVGVWLIVGRPAILGLIARLRGRTV